MDREKLGPLSGLRVPELATNVAGPLGPRLSQTPGEVRSSSPGLGEHNQEVWGGLLGLTEEELKDLRKEGFIYRTIFFPFQS